MSTDNPLIEENERLKKLVYVPGLRKCAKCNFQLMSNFMHADTGNISANNAPQQCANGCGPMWAVTERDAGNDMADSYIKLRGEMNLLLEAFGMFLNGMAYHETFPDNEEDAKQLRKSATYNFLRARNHLDEVLSGECSEACKRVYAAEIEPQIKAMQEKLK